MVLFFVWSNFLAQVGINTASPDNSSVLDISSSEKGLLIPRVDIANLATIAPITGGNTESLLVYNTNPTTGPGFFYWDGVQWVGLSASTNAAWELTGNNGTIPGTGIGQNYLGTSDNQNLIIATDGNEAIEITTNGRLESHIDGSRMSPTFTWNADPNTGIFRSEPDRFNISSGGREMVEFREDGANSEIVFNDGGNPTDLRIESNNEEHLFYTDGASNRVGIMENNPQTGLHIGGENTDVRIDALNSANNAFNNGTDNSVVFVDGDGNLTLQDRVDQLALNDSDSGTFFDSQVQITTNDGPLTGAVGYTTSITLTRETLVEFSYSVPVQLRPAGGGFIRDGGVRQYGSLLSTILPGGAVGIDIIFDSSTYTNSGDASTVTFGNFTTGGNGFALLPAGTHNLELFIFVAGGYTSDGDTEGTEGSFGTLSSSRFQIIYHN